MSSGERAAVRDRIAAGRRRRRRARWGIYVWTLFNFLVGGSTWCFVFGNGGLVGEIEQVWSEKLVHHPFVLGSYRWLPSMHFHTLMR